MRAQQRREAAMPQAKIPQKSFLDDFSLNLSSIQHISQHTAYENNYFVENSDHQYINQTNDKDYINTNLISQLLQDQIKCNEYSSPECSDNDEEAVNSFRLKLFSDEVSEHQKNEADKEGLSRKNKEISNLSKNSQLSQKIKSCEFDINNSDKQDINSSKMNSKKDTDTSNHYDNGKNDDGSEEFNEEDEDDDDDYDYLFGKDIFNQKIDNNDEVELKKKKKDILQIDYENIFSDNLISKEKIEFQHYKFKNKRHYINYLMFLHMQDYMGPLKRDLKKFMTEFKNVEEINEEVAKDMFACSYSNIQQLKWNFNKNRDMKFTKHGFVINLKIHLLQHQVLSVLRDDDPNIFKKESLIIFFNIKEQFIFTGEVTKLKQLPDQMDQSSKMLNIHVQIHTNDDNFEKILYQLSDEDFKKKYVVFEATSYYLPYKHTLLSLQAMKKKPISFEEEIIQGQYNREIPILENISRLPKKEKDQKYDQMNQYPKYKLNSYKNEHGYFKNVANQVSQNQKLDPTQQQCLTHMLTSKIALVQGPPGTGKTYITFEAIKLLLNNYSKYPDSKPILIICRRNETVNTFLKNLKNENHFFFNGKKRTIKRICLRLGSLMSAKKNGENFDALEQFLLPKKFNMKNDEIEVISKTSNALLKNLFSEDIISTRISYLDVISSSKNIFQSKEKFFPYYIVKLLRQEFFPDSNKELRILRGKYGKDQKKLFQLWWDLELNSQEVGLVFQKFSFELKPIQIKKLDYYCRQMRDSKIMYDELHKEAKKQINFIPALMNKQGEQLEPNNEGFKQYLEQFTSLSELSYYHMMVIQEFFLHQKIKDQVEQIKNSNNKIIEALKEAKHKISEKQTRFFASKKIILMTLTMSHLFSKSLIDLEPEIIITDESAEINESDIAHLLSFKPKHLIQVGDHRQLTPILQQPHLARVYYYGFSQFQRLLEHLQFPHKVLVVQRRMTKELACFVRLFYDQDTYKDSENQDKIDNYKKEKRVQKVVFIPHTFQEESKNHNFTNSFESHLCIELAKRLVLESELNPKNITIITMYKGQQINIQEEMKNSKLHKLLKDDIQICTVDSYQGKENDVIILSCVRSNTINSIGFIRDINRINVAFSRAKYAAYYIGNFQYLASFKQKENKWPTILELAQEKKLIQSNNESFQTTINTYHEKMKDSIKNYKPKKCQFCKDYNCHVGLC